jgi:uncharacterized membrane protein
MYESHQQRPLPSAGFLRRLAWHGLSAVLLLVGSVAIGMAGYMYWEQLSAIDAFLNATMLLGGMGPVDAPKTDAGKLFAGLYALYAGLVFLITAALMFTPVLHRLLHRFHWPDDSP